MKRILCLFIIVSLLAATAFATQAGVPEETPVEQAPAQEPAAENTQGVELDLTVLEGETAIYAAEVTAIVDETGRASVTQKLEVHTVGKVDTLRFSFPQDAKNVDIVGRRTKTVRENGLKYLEVTQKDGFAKTESFELYYTLSDAVSLGEQSQVLTLPLFSQQDYRTGKYTFAVALPEPFATTPRFSSGYYGGLVEDVMLVRVEDIWVVGAMKEILRDNDTLSMTLTVPEGFFAGSHGESALPTVLLVLELILLLCAAVYWLRTLRNPALRVRNRSLPPDGVNPGDIPFLLAGGQMDFNLLVSYWATLGYLRIHLTKSGHVVLQRTMDMGNERRKLEQRLFELLFRDRDICEGASLRYKRVGEKADQVIRRYWNKRLYVPSSGAPVVARALCWLACAFAAFVSMDSVAPAKGRGFFLLLALIAGFAMGYLLSDCFGRQLLGDYLRAGLGIACGIGLLVLGILGNALPAVLPALLVTMFLGYRTCHGGMRCAYGDEVISQTLGFRRFMLHVSDHHVLQMQSRDSQYFYKMLPFAEALGQGRRFAELFHGRKLEPCQWYTSSRSIPTTPESFYSHYSGTLEMLNFSLKK